METLLLLEKLIWFGFAAMGFAVLFNVPARALPVVFGLGAIGGMAKVLLLLSGVNIILSSFIGATLIGILSVYAAHRKHAPPLIFSIPSVIPMVPGAFAYKMMIGFMSLSTESSEHYNDFVYSTLSNGLKAFFILMVLAAGVALPMLITRKDSVKNLHIKVK